MMFKNKLGQLDAFGGIAIAVVVLAITLTVAFMVLDQGRDATADDINANTHENKMIAWTNGTFVSWTNTTNQLEFSCSRVANNVTGASPGTGFANQVIGAGNYSCDERGFNFTSNYAQDTFNASNPLNVTYSYKIRSKAYNGTAVLTSATNEIPGWVPLIVIVVLGGVLMTIVGMTIVGLFLKAKR